MIDLLLSTAAFERWAGQINGEISQLPFALAGAMNTAAFETRTKLADDTWPSHVTARNRTFARAALRVEKANKRSLTAAITDEQFARKGILSLQAKGGTKRAKRSAIAIPDRKVRRGAKGVAKNQRPRTLPNSFKKGDVIYQRTGAKGRSLKLMFTLKPSVSVKARVPFREDFRRLMLAGVRKSFPEAMAKAMRPRRA